MWRCRSQTTWARLRAVPDCPRPWARDALAPCLGFPVWLATLLQSFSCYNVRRRHSHGASRTICQQMLGVGCWCLEMSCCARVINVIMVAYVPYVAGAPEQSCEVSCAFPIPEQRRRLALREVVELARGHTALRARLGFHLQPVWCCPLPCLRPRHEQEPGEAHRNWGQGPWSPSEDAGGAYDGGGPRGPGPPPDSGPLGLGPGTHHRPALGSLGELPQGSFGGVRGRKQGPACICGHWCPALLVGQRRAPETRGEERRGPSRWHEGLPRSSEADACPVFRGKTPLGPSGLVAGGLAPCLSPPHPLGGARARGWALGGSGL